MESYTTSKHTSSTNVMVRPWKAGNYLSNSSWSVFILLGWRFVFGIIIKRGGREPRIVRCHRDSGNNKVASLLRLLRAKVSDHHGLAK